MQCCCFFEFSSRRSVEREKIFSRCGMREEVKRLKVKVHVFALLSLFLLFYCILCKFVSIAVLYVYVYDRVIMPKSLVLSGPVHVKC